MKVLTIIGARPQFIKAATISRAFRELRPDIEEVIVHTGQHYDSSMSDIFFNELDIPKPDYNLGIGGGTHGQNTGRMIEKLEALMVKLKPDWVLVYGDTDSTLAGALSAAKLHIKVAHVEAGLRSFNRKMPEEINRILTDHLSEALFAPTETAHKNLLTEGIHRDKIKLFGDVMYDAALFYKARARKPNIPSEKNIQLDSHSFILCTIHRAENTDNSERLQNIFEGLSASREQIILPLHPRTKNKIATYGIEIPDNISIIEPVGYLEMVWLELNSKLIATDSGGVQKEAYFFGKPCVTLRDETEWVELVKSGWNTIAGACPITIKEAISNAEIGVVGELLFGDGFSSSHIVNSM